MLIGAQAISGLAREPSAVIDISRTRGPCESPGSALIMIKFKVVKKVDILEGCVLSKERCLAS